VPLVQSLQVLIDQTDESHAAGILARIRESVEAGNTLAQALAEHPRVFPPIMSSMVRVGEMGGTLDEVLLQLADLHERDEGIKGEVRSALAYPALVLLMGIASVVLLMVVLVPRLKALFEGVGQTLPLPTRILLGTSEFLTQQGWVLAIIVGAGILALRAAFRSPRVGLAFDRFKLRIPALGKLVRNVSIARFARLLGTLTSSGISIVDGIDIVQAAVNNRVIAGAMRDMSQKVRSGSSMGATMKESGVFPVLAIQMIAVGEESGTVDKMLLRVADAYEREVDVGTRIMTSLLGPALILCVACVVAFILLSMLLPIFQLSSVIG